MQMTPQQDERIAIRRELQKFKHPIREEVDKCRLNTGRNEKLSCNLLKDLPKCTSTRENNYD